MEEIVKELLQKGGLSNIEISAIFYFACHKENDDLQESGAIDGFP